MKSKMRKIRRYWPLYLMMLPACYISSGMRSGSSMVPALQIISATR